MGRNQITQELPAACIIRKINTRTGLNNGSLQATFNHNCRKYIPKNVDKEFSYMNQEVVPLKEKNFIAAVDKRTTEEIKNGNIKSIRKDAIVSAELVFNYTALDTRINLKDLKKLDEKDLLNWRENTKNKIEENQSQIDAWVKDVLAFAEKKFGKNNIYHATLHMDEPNTFPHIHLTFCPIDERGHLCYKSFIDGPYQNGTRGLQDDFYEEVGKKYDLNRGQKYSKNKIVGTKNIYDYKMATVGRAMINEKEFEPRPEELDERGHILPSYLERRRKDEQVFRNQLVSEKTKEESYYHQLEGQLVEEQVRIKKDYYDKEKALEEEFQKKQELLEKEYQEKQSKLEEIKDKITDLLNISKTLAITKTGEYDFTRIRQAMKSMDAFTRGMKTYPDKEDVKQAQKLFESIANYQHQLDKDVKEKEDTALGGIRSDINKLK